MENINICEPLIKNANILLEESQRRLKLDNNKKIVISISGGSGVGKTTIAQILSEVFYKKNINNIVINGDNYPKRIPIYNDAERLNICRKSALLNLVKSGKYIDQNIKIIENLQIAEEDFDNKYKKEYEWFKYYYDGGYEGLKKYLGSKDELDFDEINNLLYDFKNDKKELYIKKLGRTLTEISYQKINLEKTNVIILEWTHGSSEYLNNIDLKIYLNSDPYQTLKYRKNRNRGDQIDTPFINMVLEIEQKMLLNQAKNADIILSNTGKILTHDDVIKECVYVQ